MEEKAVEEAKPEEKPESTGKTLVETLADPVELKEIKEEIIERKPNVFPLEPPQPPPEPTESAEVKLLKAQLDAANLRAELAELRAGQKSVPPIPEVAKPLPGTHPMPKPEDIPPGLPPMPPLDPIAGDKTPAVVEWFQKHWPEEYERRYAGRFKPRSQEEEDEDAPKGRKVPDFAPSSDPTVDTSARRY